MAHKAVSMTKEAQELLKLLKYNIHKIKSRGNREYLAFAPGADSYVSLKKIQVILNDFIE